MHPSKIENFRQSHGARVFPAFSSLSTEECATLRRKLGIRLGWPNNDGLSLLHVLNLRAKIIDGNAESPEFNLKNTLMQSGIAPGRMVYLNWYRLDEMDRMNFDDLNADFGDIWYPGSDDIEIIDDELGWILFVSHTGDLKGAQL
jgi:hypothetical protein